MSHIALTPCCKLISFLHLIFLRKVKVIHFGTNRFLIRLSIGVDSYFCSRTHRLATIHTSQTTDGSKHTPSISAIDVINVYNVHKKILCKRVYYFVNVYLNKNHTSETKQNYDGN